MNGMSLNIGCVGRSEFVTFGWCGGGTHILTCNGFEDLIFVETDILSVRNKKLQIQLQ